MMRRAARVLVVESDAGTRSLLDALLTDAGYTVVAVGTFAEAVAAVSTVQPDLVLSNGRLPGVPLFALIDHLRADPATAQLPVLLCTVAVREARARFGDATDPHVAVVFKPFDLGDLLEAVARLLAPMDRRHGCG